ncbi:hypothetical protein MRB53_041463 [Persea americana]|nr:hypothetical protein MRB53_041463 [Persea americana]
MSKNIILLLESFTHGFPRVISTTNEHNDPYQACKQDNSRPLRKAKRIRWLYRAVRDRSTLGDEIASLHNISANARADLCSLSSRSRVPERPQSAISGQSFPARSDHGA